MVREELLRNVSRLSDKIAGVAGVTPSAVANVRAMLVRAQPINAYTAIGLKSVSAPHSPEC
jgi:hypothetical protein